MENPVTAPIKKPRVYSAAAKNRTNQKQKHRAWLKKHPEAATGKSPSNDAEEQDEFMDDATTGSAFPITDKADIEDRPAGKIKRVYSEAVKKRTYYQRKKHRNWLKKHPDAALGMVDNNEDEDE